MTRAILLLASMQAAYSQPIICSGPAEMGCAAVFSHARQVAIAGVALTGVARASKPDVHCYRLAPDMPEIHSLPLDRDASSGLVNISFEREESGFCTGFWFDVPSGSASGHITSVKDFGAAGDGVADDYEAMQKAAAYICTNGGTLVYPPGTYHVGRYAIVGGPAKNQVKNIEYRGCRDVSILGYGAKIDIDGDFLRTADYKTGGYTYSYSNAVIPFDMISSSGFRIEGFEIDGNVNRMRRDPGVVEWAAHGIQTAACSHYALRNLRVHHCQADGVYLGASHTLADRDALLTHVVSTKNARQGLTVSLLRGGLIMDSVFEETGETGGLYGKHAPSAGVDVEPPLLPPVIDVATGEILFVRDRFAENLGWQFVADTGNESVTVIGCSVKASHPQAGGGKNGLAYMNAAAAAVTGASLFEVSNGSIIYLHTLEKSHYKLVRTVAYSDNEFHLANPSSIICSPTQTLPIHFSGNSVVVRPTGPDPSGMMLRYGAEFSGNSFFFAAAGHAPATDAQLAVSFLGSATVAANRYQTDLHQGKQHFFTDYRQVQKVAGETFESGLFFRPGPNSTFDPARTYP